MAEPDPTPHSPNPNPTATNSWVPDAPLDVAAAAAAAEGTASFGHSPDVANLDTLSGPLSPDGETDISPPGELPDIPGYRVVRIIGSGGMGTVYKAVQLTLNRYEAIKIINSGLATESGMRARFSREVKILAQLEHPNIVPIYHAGTWRGSPFLTMKFIPGKTLYHHLERLRRDLPSACRLMAKVARAVEYLHAKGIIHRDLKPLNILLTQDDTPLVADFGLVRIVEPDAELTVSVAPVGTRQFMSPEQTYGGRESYSPACDIWALGVILFELLTGTRPFGHDDPVELYRQIRHEPTPRMNPELRVPEALERITRKCLGKSPADRYASAEELARDLERWLAGEPVLIPASEPVAPAPHTHTRTSNRWVALGVLAVVALIAIPAAIVHWERPDQNSPDREPIEIVPVVPNPKPAVVERTLAERLKARETVVLIGPTGMPLLPFSSLSAFSTQPYSRSDGCCAIDSAHYGFVQLLREPLPWPVRLEGELAIRSRDPQSWGGFFVGLNETPTTTTMHQSCLILKQHVIPTRAGRDMTLVRNECQLALGWWWPGKQFPELYHDDVRGHEVLLTNDILQQNAQRLEWFRFAIEIEPNTVSATWATEPAFDPMGGNDAVTHLQSLRPSILPGPKPIFTPPAFGEGLGICVHKAEAVYRNVKLIPVRR
ncbi:MAG: serine/threonine protein kinase [Planctomycetia bacterium]|nr:serine/threonine protein kinase [Planctomycetia bacterium]